MTDIIVKALDTERKWSRVASGQLGAFEALLSYAISSLRGHTACSQEQVADHLTEKLNELLEEQKEKLFPYMKNK